MSYELNFWRYQPDVSLDHQRVYEQLTDGYFVEGLENLPIASMIARVQEAFASWQRLDEVTFDDGTRGAFQLYTTPQFFRADCYGMAHEDMNRLIDIARDFQCPLYDPQGRQRFD